MSFNDRTLLFVLLVIVFVVVIALAIGSSLLSGSSSDTTVIDNDDYLRSTMSRRDYYRNVYLKSDDWQRKRYLVLKRDNWRCVKCGNPATDVHHERYAKKIGTEPIQWLIAICRPCHTLIHGH